MLLEKIRAATNEQHQALEQTMFPFILRVSNQADYARLLRIFYGFYKPLQDAIDLHLYKGDFPDYPERRRPSWILDDLQALGERLDNIILMENTSFLHSNAHAIGAMYVMEGSTLGGKVICKTIRDNLVWKESGGFSFFSGYGSATGVKWKSFLDVLDQYSDTAEENEIITAANEVFKRFHQWIIKSYQMEELPVTLN